MPGRRGERRQLRPAQAERGIQHRLQHVERDDADAEDGQSRQLPQPNQTRSIGFAARSVRRSTTSTIRPTNDSATGCGATRLTLGTSGRASRRGRQSADQREHRK